jgi:hypothetical protein
VSGGVTEIGIAITTAAKEGDIAMTLMTGASGGDIGTIARMVNAITGIIEAAVRMASVRGSVTRTMTTIDGRADAIEMRPVKGIEGISRKEITKIGKSTGQSRTIEDAHARVRGPHSASNARNMCLGIQTHAPFHRIRNAKLRLRSARPSWLPCLPMPVILRLPATAD